MLVAVGALSLMDACLKLLSPHYSAFQVTSLRGLATLPIVLPWVATTGGFRQLVRGRLGLHALRGAFAIVALTSFTYAVRHLPLADAYTIFFVSPLMITALAVPILGERVAPRRWIAIAIGFAGVLIVLRPTGAGTLTLPGLAVLLTAAAYALSAITVRVLGRTDSTQSMVFWVMACVALGAGALALPTWRPIEAAHWPIIAGLGATGAVGQWAVTEAFKRGEASIVAPFEYTSLAWGVGLDWFLWATTPTALMWVGAAVIIATGTYLIRSEVVHVEAEHP
jgi:drug/metabolite transporter (DMT)-like permease